MPSVIDLTAIATAADPNVNGVAILQPGDGQPNWFIVARGDGVRVRLDTADGNPPLQAAIDSVTNADLSPAAVAARDTLRARSAADAAFDGFGDAAYRLLRAEALVIVDEINALRDWITQFKAGVAAAATLAALKTSVAALPNLPLRTGAQAKSAIKAKIDAGDAD